MSVTATDVMNINDSVWVRLTELGWKVFDDYHRGVGFDPGPYRQIIGPPGGWQRFQLWELAHIFGPHTYMASPTGAVFDRNVVRLTNPDAERNGP